MSATFDVAVVGLGAMGASAACALARRGLRVVGLDPYPPGHERGSSHGESRAIRLAYFEHPSYVPLARAAYAGWRELERLTGETVLTVTGILESGHPGSAIVAGSLAASAQHDLPHEVLSGRQVSDRFPELNLPSDWTAVFQPDGGFLRPERAIALYVELARAAGADLRIGVRALGIEPAAGCIRVATDHGPVEAGAAVLAAGPWMGDLVPALRPHLSLTRQVLGWFTPEDPAAFGPDRFPVFIVETPEDAIYGFPDFAGTGVKAASHHPSGVLSHADVADQDGGAADEARIRAVLARYVPRAAGPLRRLRTCLYTRTPDEDFVLDRHPDDPRLVIASPCSGHGFKFASVLGEILADLAARGSTAHDIARFTLARLTSGKSAGADSGANAMGVTTAA